MMLMLMFWENIFWKEIFSGFSEELPAVPPLQPWPGLDAAGKDWHQHLQHGLQVDRGDHDDGYYGGDNDDDDDGGGVDDDTP